MIALVPLVLSLMGFVLAVYAHHVAQYAGKKKGYSAVCDMGDQASCSKAFTSEYASTAGIANTTWGMLFYTLTALLSIAGEIQYLFLLVVAAFIGSIYLGYVLYVHVRTFCVVCTAIYIINCGLLVSTYLTLF